MTSELKLTGAVDSLERKLGELEYKFEIIKPSVRSKRGIINGLGSVIKFISGNLDQEDLDRINDKINNISNTNNNLATAINGQVSINDKLINKINNITDYINTHQYIIKEFLKDQSSQMNGVNTELRYLQAIDRISDNIDELLRQLSEIHDSIIFAKLGIIPRYVLHPGEMNSIKNYMRKQNVNIISSEHIYEILKLDAFYKDNDIILDIKIPNFINTTFTLYHLNVIPINLTKVPKIPSRYVLSKGDAIRYLDRICTKVEDQFICENSPEEKNSCILKLIEGEDDANCETTPYIPKSTVELIEPGHLLVATKEPKHLKNTCGRKNRFIVGAVLINFKNCSVTIEDQTFTNKKKVSIESFKLIANLVVPEGTNTSSTLESTQIEKLNLSPGQIIETSDGFNIKDHGVYLGITATAIITTIVAAIIIKKKMKMTTTVTLPPPPVYYHHLPSAPPTTTTADHLIVFPGGKTN